MNVFLDYRSIQNKPDLRAGSVVTIGNFDGCHVGHQKLFNKAQLIRQKIPGTQVIVLTFFPHPKDYFQPARQVGSLFNPEQKKRALAELQVDGVLIQRFDQHLMQLSPREFYEKILRQALHARAIIVGENFKFAHKRQGDVETLRLLAEKDEIFVEGLTAEKWQGLAVSSTRIRETIAQLGDLQAASHMLNRPYMIEGRIKPNKRIGSKIGFPTANIDASDQILPLKGVYAAYVWVDYGHQDNEPALIMRPQLSKLKKAVVNVGYRPTLQNSSTLAVEAHILDWTDASHDLYGLRTQIYFLERLRDEITFNSSESLVNQIKADINSARMIFKSYQRAQP